MNWSNVRLIFLREFRDQLRDRRTLFTIVVLPLLLYPLLGMSFLQVAQFMQEHPTSVWIIGTDALPKDPPLLGEQQVAENLCSPDEARLLALTIDAQLPPEISLDGLRAEAEKRIQAGEFDVVVYIPPGFGDELDRFKRRIARHDSGAEKTADDRRAKIPQPQVFSNLASDRSRIAHERISSILRAWRREFVQQSLVESNIPITVTEPFELTTTDVAQEMSRRAAVWSKILPFIVLIWALTGAFYPAIDLCAGEKERGTLETLLSSPALRSEIVWGKLLTVMIFSICTAVLNLFSMGFTGSLIINRMEALGSTVATTQIGPPPFSSVGWLLLALIPMSALFSALSLAVASFARSSKEGQYYLMPLLLITLPLMILPMLPATSLDLGTALIPVAGMMLLLRAFVEGQYTEALLFVPPVFGITALCCLAAIRWAVDQFNNDTVLFRESERWGLGIWIKHLVRDRGDTPTFGEAVLCGVLLLLIRFFAGFLAPAPEHWSDIAATTLILQIALIATPVLLMAIMLTRNVRKTLSLNRPRLDALIMAPLLALVLHPSALWLSGLISRLYPLTGETASAVQEFSKLMAAASWWQVLLVIALTPAICEELSFRGFILSGLQQSGKQWTAILVSSLFFGITHSILQQSISAFFLGIVIGYMAVQSGSIWPCMLFHLTHNSLGMLFGRLTTQTVDAHPQLQRLFEVSADGLCYSTAFTILSPLLSMMILLWFRRLPHEQYSAEHLQRTLDHSTTAAPAR